MVASASTREVLIRLKGEVDPSLRDSFRAISQQARASAQAQIKGQDEATRAGAVAGQKSLDQARKAAGEKERIARQEAAVAERAAKQASREEEREVKDSIRRAKARENAVQRSYQAQARAAKQASREEERAQKAVARASGQAVQARQRLLGIGSQVVSAGLGMARGGLLLGLLGSEEDTQKFLQTLVKIEGGIAILQGGVQVWRLLSMAAQQYNKVLAATALAETAVAAAQARRGIAGAGAVAAVSGGREAAILQATTAGGVAAGGGRAAGIAGGVAAGGGRAAGIAGGVAAGGMMGGGVGTYGILAMEGLALAGIGAEATANAFGNYPKPGSFRSGVWDRVASVYASATGGLPDDVLMAPYQQLAASNETTKKAQARSEQQGPQLAAARQQYESSQAAQRQRSIALRETFQYNKTALTPRAGGIGFIGTGAVRGAIRGSATDYEASARIADMQREAMAQEQARQLQGGIGFASDALGRAKGDRAAASKRYEAAKGVVEQNQQMGPGGNPDQGAAIEDMKRSYAELQQAEENVVQKTKELTDITVQGQRQKIEALNAEKKARQDIVAGLENEQKSVKQRFGEASAGTRARLISIMERARAGGKLSQNEANILRQYGGTEAQGILNQRAEKIADRGGFKRFVGDFYERETKKQEGRIGKLDDQTLEVEQKITVELVPAAEEFRKETTKALQDVFEEYNDKLLAALQKMIRDQKVDVNSN